MTNKTPTLSDKKHTYKNFPFLKQMKKDGWYVHTHNKHILIQAYIEGFKAGSRLTEDKE